MVNPGLTRWLSSLLFLVAALAGITKAQECTTSEIPRVVVYYQTTNDASGNHVHISLLPLISEPNINVTHVLVAAFHINDGPGNIHLNDYPPSDPRFDQLWSDTAQLQAAGVKVLGMMGGAAAGSYKRLDGNQTSFEAYYGPLRQIIGQYNLQGIDLDVEESMSLTGIIRLIDRLRADFGPDFIITMAPVASALSGGGNLSGFSYDQLNAQRGSEIAFYNAQFYYGWGSARTSADYEKIVKHGYPADKVTMSLLTNPDNGSGYVDFSVLNGTLNTLKAEYANFGGVAGWEFFNSLPGNTAQPWTWAQWMTEQLRGPGCAAVQKSGTIMVKLANILTVPRDLWSRIRTSQ